MHINDDKSVLFFFKILLINVIKFNVKTWYCSGIFTTCDDYINFFRKSGGTNPWSGVSAWNRETPAETGSYHMSAYVHCSSPIFPLQTLWYGFLIISSRRDNFLKNSGIICFSAILYICIQCFTIQAQLLHTCIACILYPF